MRSSPPAPPLPDRVLVTTTRHRMLPAGTHVLVACSGGPDSMALLLILHDLRARLSIELSAATVDHSLRDATSEHALVEQRCRDLGIPWRLLRVQVRQKTGSVQTAAREARLAALRSAMTGAGATAIALGHTATDQAETVILRLLRGAGLRGLAGMAPVRRPLVRPLIELTRAEVLAFLAERGEPWASDPSNLSPAFLRNRIRHEAMPVLEALAPDAERRIAAAASLLREDLAALEATAEAALKRATVGSAPGRLELDLLKLRSEPRGLEAHVLRRALERVRRTPSDVYRVNVEDLRRLASGVHGSAELHLPGARAHRRYGTLVVEATGDANSEIPPPGNTTTHQEQQQGNRLPGTGCYRIGSVMMTVERLRASEAPIKGDPREAIFDASGFRFPVTVRAPKRGERLVPYGMTGRKLVSELLKDARVPRRAREEILVVADDSEVLWVVGLRRAARYPVEPGTREVIRLRVHDLGPLRSSSR